MNAKKLIPITGALIAGLIGVKAADCYGFTTHYCLNGGTVLVNPYPPGTGCYPLVSTGGWIAYDGYEITEPGHEEDEAARNIQMDTLCQGYATYLDCQGYPHTIYYADYNNPGNTYDRPMFEGYPPPCEW